MGERFAVAFYLTDGGRQELEIDAAERERLTAPSLILNAAQDVSALEFITARGVDGSWLAVRRDLIKMIDIAPVVDA